MTTNQKNVHLCVLDMNAAYEEGQEEDEYGQQPVTKVSDVLVFL